MTRGLNEQATPADSRRLHAAPPGQKSNGRRHFPVMQRLAESPRRDSHTHSAGSVHRRRPRRRAAMSSNACASSAKTGRRPVAACIDPSGQRRFATIRSVSRPPVSSQLLAAPAADAFPEGSGAHRPALMRRACARISQSATTASTISTVGLPFHRIPEEARHRCTAHDADQSGQSTGLTFATVSARVTVTARSPPPPARLPTCSGAQD